MNAFNIHVPYLHDQVTLTILPVEAGYQVIYFGKIAALLSQNDGGWQEAPLASTDLGDLPLYDPEAFPENPPLVIDRNLLLAIGREIDMYLQTASS
ncbi:hypothetical protein C7T94_09220 [Pedobacter yulinensis]|uniref:Uncharacterized protein n=1 Tax=Pedobacter yulinensis TaxID=2126353 RepID=A0A2T3HK76_9SPHI|nr:hypothetical protein [Pedobacter yulinensis]PST82813.1 hypothetical protein C7T94_09220 [Pedobacter yulinensis]